MSAYPTCARSFMNVCLSNQTMFQKYTKYICDKKVRAFDVTLRDGLQGLSLLEQSDFTTEKKKDIYYNIVRKYGTHNLEVGACVNYKMLPMFQDTREFVQYLQRNHSNRNHYVLVPNEVHLMQALSLFGVTNFSFIMSVSNSFQLKNTKMNLLDTFKNLINMMFILDDLSVAFGPTKVKLYVSCINECPIEGRLDNQVVVENLVTLRNYIKPNTMCLSDTCGTLSASDFSEILQGLDKNLFDLSKVSLHLHVRPEREEEVEKIVHMALDHGIVEFDVSDLPTGGCSVTMDKGQLAPNMSYAQYYKFLTTYLIKKEEKF